MPASILEERRHLVERLRTASENLAVVAAYVLALCACPPESSIVRDDSGLFLSVGALAANALELLVLAGAHMSLRRDRRPDAAARPRSLGQWWIARRETLLADAGLTLSFWILFRAQSRILLFMALFLAMTPLLDAVFRRLLAGALRSNLLRREPLNLLVVGANERGLELSRESLEHPYLGFSIVGFVDDEDFTGGEIPLLGKLGDLSPILRDKVVDVIVICLPIRSRYDDILAVMRAGEDQGIPCECPGSFFPAKACVMGEDAAGAPVVSPCPPNAVLRCGYLATRLFDLATALALAAVFSPVMLLAAVRIKIEDGGPLFFVQPRVGLNKRVFNLYKFRSMVVDAEQRQPSLEGANEMDGPVFKIKNDPRTTRVGRWMRKYNIDEMPQLINVLRGDMSVVGPRPMSLRDYHRLTEDWIRRRFTVKPGLTCYWQTMPERNSMRFSEWMTLDMRYIENRGLWEDVVICLRTIPALLRGSGV